MSAEIPAEALQLRSLVRANKTLELFLDMVPVPAPGPDEVLIRVEAAPLHPSDMGLLFGGANMAAVVAGCTRSTGRSTSGCASSSRPERRRPKARPRS